MRNVGGYNDKAVDWIIEDWTSLRSKIFFLLQNVHARSGAHSSFYPMDTRPSVRVKRQGPEDYHPASSSVEIKLSGGAVLIPHLHAR
jgi:hypothetical protein